MATKKTHFGLVGRMMAICGANQGMKRRSRVMVTTDTAKVTCGKCQKHMHGMDQFSAELADRLHLPERTA